MSNPSTSKKHISLEEAIDFVTRSDDESECGDISTNTFDDIDDFGEPDLALSDNENDDLTEDENSESEDAQVNHCSNNVATRHYHQRTKKRLVRDIDSALDERNYDVLELDDADVEEVEVIIEKKRKEVIKKVTWTTKKPDLFQKHGRSDVITNRPGVKRCFWNATNIADAWNLFIDPQMIEHIVDCTNECIREKIANTPQSRKESNKIVHLYVTCEREMRAFLGLWYIRGALNWATHQVRSIYSATHGNKIFNATMSSNRFTFLCSNLRFDHQHTRNIRFKSDRATAFREIYEHFNRNCAKVMVPDEFLSLDETLYPTRVGIAFRQYNKSKPAKYGLLFRSINSAEMPYTYNSIMYAGKPIGEPDPHYISGTEEIVQHLVSFLESHVNINGRNISCDRFYKSLPLANWCLQHNITMVGTIMTNRKGVGEIKSLANRENLSTKVYWEKDGIINITSYVVNTKSSGKRNILVLSTMPPIMGITKDDEKKKPAIIKLYDFTKGGTDIVDQKMSSYSVKPKSSKWTICSFSYILDVARVNATTVTFLNNKMSPKTQSNESFKIAWDLGMSLILPQPHYRHTNSNGLRSHTQQAIRDLLGIKIVKSPVAPGTRKRCKTCLFEIQGEQCKKKKDALGKTTHRCEKCEEPLCTKHFQKVCPSCFE